MQVKCLVSKCMCVCVCFLCGKVPQEKPGCNAKKPTFGLVFVLYQLVLTFYCRLFTSSATFQLSVIFIHVPILDWGSISFPIYLGIRCCRSGDRKGVRLETWQNGLIVRNQDQHKTSVFWACSFSACFIIFFLFLGGDGRGSLFWVTRNGISIRSSLGSWQKRSWGHKN